MSLVLFFGRPTLGPLLELLPGSKNLFFRRFLVGVQLAGLLLAGAGAASLATWTAAATRRATRALHEGDQALGTAVGGLAVGCLSLAVLVAGWSFVNGQAQSDATFISAQSSQGSAAAQLGALVAIVKSDGGGRTFAGDPSDWGDQFTVGEVPVYEYLADESVDEVGLTLRTASLMSDPEVDFDETNPADYAAFGVRWLILPSNMAPPVPAKSLLVRGAYALWELPANGYVQLVDTRGVISADSGDLGSASRGFLAGLSSKDPVYPTVAYEGGPAAAATLRPERSPRGLRAGCSPRRPTSTTARSSRTWTRADSRRGPVRLLRSRLAGPSRRAGRRSPRWWHRPSSGCASAPAATRFASSTGASPTTGSSPFSAVVDLWHC